MSGEHLAVRLEAARKGDHTHRIFRRNLETPGNSRSGSFQNRVLRECHKNGPEIHIPLGNKQITAHKNEVQIGFAETSDAGPQERNQKRGRPGRLEPAGPHD